jgi:hypothetical protein
MTEPAGIGPRRIEILEDVTLIDASFPLFAATRPAGPHLRRANSFDGPPRDPPPDDRHVRNGRPLIRASSVAPARDDSIDRYGGTYYNSRDAYDVDPARSSTQQRSVSTSSSLASPALQQTLETNVAFDGTHGLPLVGTPEDEPPAFVASPIANGHSSAPVSSSARSSFEGASHDPTPPAPPRPTPRAPPPPRNPSVDVAPSPARHARFQLPAMLGGKGKERAPSTDAASRRRDTSPNQERSRSRGRQMNLKAIKDALVSSVGDGRPPEESDDEEDGGQHTWREFKVRPAAS